MRDILTALEADKKIDNFEEEVVAIIEEIAEVLDKLPSLRDVRKEEFLEERQVLLLKRIAVAAKVRRYQDG